MQENIIEQATKMLSKLPSLGPRVAKRIILQLTSNKEKSLLPLIKLLQNLNEKVHQCKICANIDEGEICKICKNERRDNSIICVVEEVSDLWAIERAEIFKGKYHILGGKLSALSGVSIENLNLDNLHKRLKSGEVKELIIATSATIDGQTTAHFLTENLKEYDLKMTRLAYGMPMGSELDYLDDGTINIAFRSRSEF